MDCHSTNSRQHCTCTYDCDKRGNCCKCILHHRDRGEIPACFFTPEGERTYDRSLCHFARDRGL